jgi:hypothetical protein
MNEHELSTCPHIALVIEPKIVVKDGKHFAWLRIRCQACRLIFPVLNGQTEPQHEPP